MIILDNTTPYDCRPERLETLARALSDRDIEVLILDDDAIRALNRQHRGIDRATDVLSFPLEGDYPHLPLGTVAISLDHARAKARELGHTLEEEIALLFVHGLLHLLGYDHETDTGQMRHKEHELIRQFGLPESLIVRTEAV